MLKAIIFDFDGVLGNTYDINYAAAKAVVPHITKEDFLNIFEGQSFERAKAKIKAENISRFFQIQKQSFTKEHLFPLDSILTTLAQQYKLFIVSSTIDSNIEYFLKLNDSYRLFTKILGASTHASKVHKFQMICKEFNFQAFECLFITDTTGDIKDGHKASIKTMAVSWGYHTPTQLLSEKPLTLVNNKEELMKTITAIAKDDF